MSIPTSMRISASDLLRKPEGLLTYMGATNYASLIPMPEFQSLVLEAPHAASDVAWEHMVNRDVAFLSADAANAMLLEFASRPSTFDVIEVCRRPETFCPESWLRIYLLATIERWIADRRSMPTHTYQPHGRVASWVDASGVVRKINHPRTGRMHNSFKRACIAACLRGMRAGQYRALVTCDRLNIFYPHKLTVTRDARHDPLAIDGEIGALTAAPPANGFPWPQATGCERACFAYVARRGEQGLSDLLAAKEQVDAGEYPTRDALREAAKYVRQAVHALDWLQEATSTELVELGQPVGLKVPAYDRDDTTQLFVQHYASAVAGMTPGIGQSGERMLQYADWAAADAAEGNAGTLTMRMLAERTHERIQTAPLPAGVSPSVTVVAACTILWTLGWVTPKMIHAGRREALEHSAVAAMDRFNLTANDIRTAADVFAIPVNAYPLLAGNKPEDARLAPAHI